MNHRRRQKLVLLALAFFFVAVCIMTPWKRGYRYYVFVRNFEMLEQNTWGLTEYRHRQTGIIMVWIPGGTFTMGSSPDEIEQVIENWLPLHLIYAHLSFSGSNPRKSWTLKEWQRDFKERAAEEEAAHTVTLDSFLLAKHEIARSVWDNVMHNRPMKAKGETGVLDNISWEDCRDFCERTGLCFPTEAQWEYAARAGKRGPCWYGALLPGFSKDMDPEVFWKKWWEVRPSNRPYDEDPLGENGFGLFNMYVGDSEYCRDWYDPHFYQRAEACLRNPMCKVPTQRKDRCCRGAGRGDGPLQSRAAARSGCDPVHGAQNYTFRPAYYPLP